MASYYGTVGLAQPDLATLNSETHIVPADEALLSSDFRMARKLYHLWKSLTPGIPNINQLKPGSLDPTIMSNMVILDVLEDDYQWRLFGTAHTDQYGDDLTGQRISSVIKKNPSIQAVRNIFDTAKTEPEGAFFELHYLNEGLRTKVATGVMVPLADDHGRIVQLCGCCDWC